MVRNELFKRLNQPFPSQGSLARSVRSYMVVGGFIAAFLYLFKPFDMHNVKDQALQMSISYGLVTFVFGVTFDVFTRAILKLKTDLPSWTLWKWVLLSMLLLCWIAIGNFLLMTYYHGGSAANINVGLKALKYTVMLGLLPVFASGMFIQLRAIKTNQSHAQSLLFPESTLCQEGDSLESEQAAFELSADEQFSINPNDVLFVEAMQNYVMVHYQIRLEYRTQMLRSTIADALLTLNTCEQSRVVRCHRSYLVNLMVVGDIKGNAQGLRLTLKLPQESLNLQGSLLTVPVSRSYITEFKAAIAKVVSLGR